jgi:phosphoglycolate phosphatase
MKRYAAVVFDWDGTVMNSTHSIVSAIQLACADIGLPVPAASQASWVIGLSLESALYHCVPTLTAGQMPEFLV